MILTARLITDPSPVWDKIKSYLVDDNKELDYVGQMIGIFNDDKMVGAFLIKQMNAHCFEIHGGVHPDFWGKGPKICEFLGKVLFNTTPCLKIVAIIPEFNYLMRRCVKKIGMKQEGVITRSFLKWMKLHDQHVYGISKSDESVIRRL